MYERLLRRNGVLIALVAVLLSGYVARAQELFRDDFDGVRLDPGKWSWQDRNWPVGQTWFKGPPDVSGGLATFTHHTYNQYDPGRLSCLGQEIYSNVLFERLDGLEFEARVRLRTPMAGGLVASFFAYMDEQVAGHIENDEIDFEFLSNQLNKRPDTHQVIVATYDDFWGQWDDPDRHIVANPAVFRLDLGEFNVFKIRWWPDRTEWRWDPTPRDSDVLIFATTDAQADEPLTIRFNFWAATSIWPLAWDPGMVPTNDPTRDAVCFYDVDYVVVRRIADCNRNGVPDAVDVQQSSSDCNGNSMPDECEPDSDGDGVIDACDACSGSNVGGTIAIDGCDTGVANSALGNGCTMADEIAKAAAAASNHGNFVSRVAHLTNRWVRQGLLSGAEKGRIARCAARAR